ncbi:hypothetical protein QE152_g19254 [Popillia japonica]|uniref:Uncharacterized protein n=1 Tax=Popillia japonica TaxID=7064 RepID=A0AAW1KPU1_POPJA
MTGLRFIDWLFLDDHFQIQCTRVMLFIDICPFTIENLIEDVNNTQKEALSNDEDEQESTPMLSNAQALSAVNDLRRYVSSDLSQQKPFIKPK